MQKLLEHIPLDGIPLIASCHTRTEQHFKGFYHWHQCCEILIVHEGEGTVTVGPQAFTIRPGALFFFQPFQLHKVFASPSTDKPYVRSIIHLNQAVCMSFLDKFPNHARFFNHLCYGASVKPCRYICLDETSISASLRLHFMNGGQSGVSQQENHIIFLLQMLSLLQTYEPQDSLISSGYRQPQYAEQIMQWIERNFSHSFELSRLAEELHISKSYASRMFKKETGSTITEYLLARRIKQACHLLETTSQPIDVIASALGFNTAAYFIAQFKQIYRTTPLQYRKHKLSPDG
ncbi:AraC family transcriptional regulator [Paenibacillus sp. USHLN196]|uniref:AraC family transcriptional regulator n=1 Tax=Paenibacillus sp. USHLN196 TaxID=3081291 RepID=UPI00301A3F8A